MRSTSVFLLLVVACGGGGGAPSPEAPSNRGGGGGYVIWSRAGDAAATSTWLDADGTVRGKAAGVYVVHGGKLARVDHEELELKLTGCEGVDGEEPQPSKGSATQLSLVDVAGGATLALNTPPDDADGDGMGELDHGASVVGGLGRFLMISEGASTYGCGAHGNGDSSAHLFDLESGAVAPMTHAGAVIARLRPAALEKFRAAEQDFDGEEIEPDQYGPELNLGETVPQWRGGALVMRHLLWISTCYACSFGDWASYTGSIWFDDDQVPAPFDAEAAGVPAAVGQALTAASAGATEDQPVATGVSWGTPDDSWAATFKP